MKEVKANKIRSKILIGVCLLILFNILSMFLWFTLKIKPVVEMTKSVKQEIKQNEISRVYNSQEDLFNNIDEITKKYNIKFSVLDFDENELTDIALQDDDVFLFTKGLKIENTPYILNAYLGSKSNISSIIFELISFQLVMVTMFLGIIFVFARSKIILPVEKIIQDIRNYKFGKKPEKRELNNEFDLIQNEFVNLTDALEEEKKEQNRIIASISHDIKTPLTSIIGYSNLINDSKLTKEEVITYNKKITDKSLHIKNVLNTFDEYIINQNNNNLKKTQIELKGLISYLKDEYEIELKNNNIEFIINTSLKKEILDIDILKIKRVFSNVISNSVRYLKDGGKIMISIEKDNDNYIFKIKDNGPGVKVEIIDKIFDPLFTTDASRKISGLGLSICKEFVNMHGGIIEAYNDNGFVIKFTIPIIKE